MDEFSTDVVFDANLPDVAAPVRINSLYEAQVFVRRWMIRDKDPSIRLLCRKLQRRTVRLRLIVRSESQSRSWLLAAYCPSGELAITDRSIMPAAEI
jgi:hypothetical protein